MSIKMVESEYDTSLFKTTNNNEIAGLFLRKNNVLVEGDIKGYLKFLSKDINLVMSTDNTYFVASQDHITKRVMFKPEDINIDIRPKDDYQDIFDQHKSHTYKVWAIVKQVIETKNHITNEVTIETTYPKEGYQPQVIAEIPVMLFDREKQKLYSSKFDVQGVILHKGAPVTLLPYDTYANNKMFCLNRKMSSINTKAIDIWSVDYLKPTVTQRFSIMYKKHSRRSDYSVMFSFSMFKEDVPVVTLLIAFGLINHSDIMDCISQDREVRNMFMTSLSEARFTIEGKENTTITNQEEAMEELCANLKYSTNIQNSKIYMKNVIENIIFPHIHHSLYAKGVYLCACINRVLLANSGFETVDNRDSYAHKRLESVRNILVQIYMSSKEKLMRDIRKSAKRIFYDSMLFDETTEVPNLISHIKFNIMFKDIKSALNVGFWKKTQYHTPKTVSDSLKNVNNLAEAISMIRKLPSPSNLENNSNYGPRLVQGDHYGFVCMYSTPEGKQVGLTTELALSAQITNGNEEVIPLLLDKFRDLTFASKYGLRMLEDVAPKELYWLTKVYLYGDIIAVTNKGRELFEGLREMRFSGEIVRDHVGITLHNDELNINTGHGRIFRPYLVVRNNEISLPKDAINMIKSGKIDSWDSLLKVFPRDIEYLDIQETTLNALVASDEIDLQKAHKLEQASRNNAIKGLDEVLFNQYTHCEIHPIFALSAVAATIPLSNHNQSPKNMAQWRMRKQAITALPNNYITNRTRKYELWNPQKPLSCTFVSRELNLTVLPSGENVYVAIASYYGSNQEDSLIMNQTAIERGMFRANFTRLYTDVIDSNSDSSIGKFKKPNPMQTWKKNVNFAPLSDEGYAPLGTFVDGDRNDVLINKQIPVINVKGGLPYKNIQIKMRRGERGTVECVKEGVNYEGNKYIKLTVLSERIPEVGDKFASRHGQKGTIGEIYHQAYMPYSGGIVADIVLNPHMLPSRMTTGQLLECIINKQANASCTFADSTPYQKLDLEKLSEKMIDLGFDEYGREITTCGLTGLPMENKIFFGPTYYQRLRHMVADKVNARGFAGPITQTTRQPTDGRARDGGYKIGEMERDGLLAHGISTAMRQLFTCHSDGKVFNVCTNIADGKACGTFAYQYDVTEDGKTIYMCPMCKSSLHIVKVAMPYTFKLMIQLLYGMKVRCRIVVDTEHFG